MVDEDTEETRAKGGGKKQSIHVIRYVECSKIVECWKQADSSFDTFTSVILPVIVRAADVELAGTMVFIFRASRSGLEAAGAVLTLMLGIGSKLITGMAELDTVGRGAARRLLRVGVGVVVDAAGWVDMAAGGVMGFSGSGARHGQSNRQVMGQSLGLFSQQTHDRRN